MPGSLDTSCGTPVMEGGSFVGSSSGVVACRGISGFAGTVLQKREVNLCLNTPKKVWEASFSSLAFNGWRELASLEHSCLLSVGSGMTGFMVC